MPARRRISAPARVAFTAAPDAGSLVSVSRAGRVLASASAAMTGDLLAALDRALLRARVLKTDVHEIAVDRGPGGFSAVRRRVALALALAHALEASVAACDGLSPEAAAALPDGAFSRETRIAPRYDRPPNITKSQKPSPLAKR